jgi:hypothetical protein
MIPAWLTGLGLAACAAMAGADEFPGQHRVRLAQA